YLFAGTVFIGEYLFRRYRFKDHDHPSFIDYLCIVARANIRKFDMPGTSIPLIKHYTPNAAMIYCPQRGKTETNKTLRATLTPSSQKGIINQATFLSAAMALAEKLPDHSHAINLCQDRSLFLLSFTAVLLRSMTNLLPPNRQQQTVIDIASDYHDCFVIADSAQDYQQLSIFRIDTLNCYHQTTDVTIPKPPLIEAEHIAAITFTSGSTGKPSANKKLWRTLVGTAARLAKRFLDKDTSPTIVATVPPQHMYGLEMTIMMALQGRCSMATGQPFYPQDIATTLTAIPQPRFLITTPAHLRAIQGAAIDMPQVHCIISSTAPLAETLAADSENLFQAQVKEIYGCTEAGSAATRRTNATDEWLLLDGMQLNQHGDNIEISGPHLSTSIELQDHLEILPDNRFRFLGRANDILNVAGKRASLADINQKLLDIDGVEDSVIFVPKCVNNKASRPAALVVSALSKRAILAALSQQIDPIFLPRPLRKVSHLPRNETGKLQHGILEQLLLQEQQGANTNE
ncbi:MAG: AMP-binding protein, partial [Pseudomonadales bacterium]